MFACAQMLVLGAVLGVFEDALALAACLAVQSPYKWARRGAPFLGRRFDSAEGDPFSLLNIFDGFMRVRAPALGYR